VGNSWTAGYENRNRLTGSSRSVVECAPSSELKKEISAQVLAMKIDSKDYLNYLDKEMTIMGILSAISVAAPAGILNAVLGEQSGTRALLWLTGRHFIVVGSALCVLAAFYFYKERSGLAWFYGQICLVNALDDTPSASTELRELLRGADSWESWWSYSWGFTLLVAGFTAYLFALFFYLVPPYSDNLRMNQSHAKAVGLCLVLLVASAVAATQKYVLTHDDYKFSEEPWSDFWSCIKNSIGRTFPHDKAYTRLQCSPISGIGVFAIRDIPKGTQVFKPDDDELVSVNVGEIEKLFKPGDPIRRLYEDFCVLRGKIYQCPVSFNKLTPPWFLNHSESPNVAADLSLKFYAIHEIKAGKELTADYRTYSDNGVGSFSGEKRG
jgi:hypothetical protein